jgi:hypothetical protein
VACRAAVRSARAVGAQPEPALGVLAGFPHPVKVIPSAGLCAVLAGQGRHDVNVIARVPDRRPPHPQVISLRRQPCAVHDPSHQVRVGVLISPARPVQLSKQAADIRAAQDFPDHRERPGPFTELPEACTT